METNSQKLSIEDVNKLVHDAYIPFAQEQRAIPWPEGNDRQENDAEHSFSLALVGMALGERLGLDPEKIAYYAVVHDLAEVFAGDTSVWDDERRKTKQAREAAALEQIGVEFSRTPILATAIRQYDDKQDEEARFVYALDKLMALVMIVRGNGKFWKDNGITYEQHRAKAREKIKEVALHPTVKDWYQELLDDLANRRTEFYAPS